MSCVTNTGYSQAETIRSAAVANAATIRQVAAAIIAIDNANRLIGNYSDQRDVSQRAINIAKAQQNQLETVFWPRELQFLAEFSTPEAIETVEAMGARYAGRLVSGVAGAFAEKLRELRCGARRYCTSAKAKEVQDLMLARGVAMANARVLGRNIAFAEYQARHDVNLSRRMQAVAIGRGLIDQAMTLYAAAGRGFAAAGQVLSTQLNSAFEAFGAAREQGRIERERQAAGFPESAVMSGVYPNAGPMPTMPGTGFGLQTSAAAMMNPAAGDLMVGDQTGLSERNQPNVFQHLQAEKLNEGDVGRRDLARTGKMVFPVIGGMGTVLVDMDRFPLAWVDHKKAGDFGS